MAAPTESMLYLASKATTPESNDDLAKKNPRQRFQKQKKIPMKKWRKNNTKGLTEKQEIEMLKETCETFDSKDVAIFKDFPISTKTKLGLEESGYQYPTEIQRESIGLALKGCDILGAAKTGSGKTLAFLVPVLEKLYKEMWSKYYGLGALIITPTRELAYQIFEVLKKVGVHHDFSAGLIIGGKDLKFERKRMDSCNIVVCTPGRLLQHMDENPLFDATQLQILVLDEADRILDLGFEKTMNAIIENLPVARQTLLFSATQTKSVKDLARLSLKRPMYVSVHEHAKFTTPEGLQQSYVVCELHAKMNLLWSFIKNHLKQKVLVFVSSCKQVKFIFRCFCRMRPGTTLLALHGDMHQMKRMATYVDFCRKQNAVLIATDLAARGLDFPSVNWVFQLDCPEDVSTYIHRAGRTARLEKDGEALLVLLPSEESMAQQLIEKKIPIEKIEVDPRKLMNIQGRMGILCARDNLLKECAQRCFTAYLKNVFLMKDKTVFDVKALDLESFARSLGLALAPRVRFLQKHLKEMERKKLLAEQKKREKDERLHAFHGQSDSEGSDEENIFTVKRRITYDEESNKEAMEEDAWNETEKVAQNPRKVITKAALARKVLNKKILPNKKVTFDGKGEVMQEGPNVQRAEAIKDLLKDENTLCGIDVEISKKIMREEDKFDKQRDRERVKAKHKAARLKLKEERRAQLGLPPTLEAGEEEEEEEEEEEDSESEGSGPYEEEGSEGDQSSDEEGTTSNFEEAPLCSQKRKRERGTPVTKKRRRRSPSPLDTGLDLEDDEALALRMLSQR